ncbi:MAG: hypothetical protein QM723_20120 [Myxococcaceae bacterium]
MVGFVGGLGGYACGAAFSPVAAHAQSQQGSNVADAGVTTPSTPSVSGACAQWSVAPVSLGALSELNPAAPSAPPRGTTYIATTLEEGWEPFAGAAGYSDVVILARRCVK